ncbi:TPA: nucleoside triphosphate pyrophosphohydrolase [Candidatus Woesearchaeota archaeon]|nr:phosphoribosyl-ATP pyrophosphohydrolase [archaeon]HIJ12091.1 nucleoside triphosphate pyrophosphohydrolase [Candidatus Woesearchaeota archaeon]|tara:strand:+ start:127 stop:435 length:309 start_codon:yes stop_codon:yes gene_type:complete
MKIYNKLVRDKIPMIIIDNNQTPSTRIVDDKEYFSALKTKLQEEVTEYLESHDPEELADIMEVIHALAEHKGISVEEIETIRKDKKEERGGFSKRIMLEHVT